MFPICRRLCHMFKGSKHDTTERQLQQCLNKLQSWSNENGFKFPKTKIKCMHFCIFRCHHPNLDLYLNKTRIDVVTEFKFLGVIFETKLTFLPHINALKKKCKKSPKSPQRRRPL